MFNKVCAEQIVQPGQREKDFSPPWSAVFSDVSAWLSGKPNGRGVDSLQTVSSSSPSVVKAARPSSATYSASGQGATSHAFSSAIVRKRLCSSGLSSVLTGLRVSLSTMHPRKTAMMPKNRNPDMESNTRLLRRRFVVLKGPLGLEYSGREERTPLQMYSLSSGSSLGVTVSFS